MSTRVTASRAGIEDTHAIICEFDPRDVFLVLAEVLAQRHVERMDRAVAFRGRDQRRRRRSSLSRPHGDGDALAARIEALLDIGIEFFHVEEFWHLAERRPAKSSNEASAAS